VDTSDGSIVNPGQVSNGGVVGQEFLLKAGDPHCAPAPSQFYPIQIPPGETPEICKACASGPGGSDGPGAALYRHNIACCNTNQFVCGTTVEVEMEHGNMVGPTRQGVRCLINQGNGNSFPNGQDVLNPTTLQITAGTSNPHYPAGTIITSSDSIVTVPLYDGHELCPGSSCGSSVTIVGFLQIFIKQTDNGGGGGGSCAGQGAVTAYVMAVSGCGMGGSSPTCDETGEGGSSGTVGTGGEFVPVRLVQDPANLTFP
jgi:hypothetical protein